MSKYRNFIRICGRDFNMDFITSIEICEAIMPEHSVCTIEYKDKSITYPVVGTVEENLQKLDDAYSAHYRNVAYPIIRTGIERK